MIPAKLKESLKDSGTRQQRDGDDHDRRQAYAQRVAFLSFSPYSFARKKSPAAVSISIPALSIGSSLHAQGIVKTSLPGIRLAYKMHKSKSNFVKYNFVFQVNFFISRNDCQNFMHC